jgi:hypothetical protein
MNIPIEHMAVLQSVARNNPAPLNLLRALYERAQSLLAPGNQVLDADEPTLLYSRLTAKEAVLAVVTDRKTGVFIQLALPGSEGKLAEEKQKDPQSKPTLLLTVGRKLALEQQIASARNTLYF